MVSGLELRVPSISTISVDRSSQDSLECPMTFLRCTMYPYPEFSGVCIRVVPKAAYATIADQFRVISKQYTIHTKYMHTVCLRAVNGICTTTRNG